MKRRTTHAKKRAEWKSRLRAMSEEQKRDFNETRRKTAQSGYAKRQRERDNGAPMSDRTHEGVRRRFVTPRSFQPELSKWCREFWRVTA